MALEKMLIGLAAVVVICYIFKKLIEMVLVIFYVQKMPGPPKFNLFFGNMRPLHGTSAQIFNVLRKWGLEYYPIYKLWLFFVSVANIMSPEDLALILPDMKHSKKSKAYDLINKWLGKGLLTSYGTHWQVRRKILTPAFHFSILQDFILTFNESTEELVEILKKEVGKPFVEITPLVTQFTLKVIGETAMGVKFDFNTKQAKEYKEAFHKLISILLHRIFRPYLAYTIFYIFSPKFYEERKLVRLLHNFTNDIIAKRRNDFHRGTVNTQKKKRLAMLDLLLTAQKEEGIIDDEGIREEVDTFMFEGHDTVSAAINFTLLTLANHPKVQEEIVQEMKDVLGDVKKKPLYNDLQELKYMERVIKEVLRLYPSVHYISRELGKDLVTATGYKLKKGTILQLHIYDLHYNPVIYPDPEKFDPDRFLPENCDKRHPYAYIPFSAGPRNCIGQRFAMLELKTVLCGLLSNFILQPVDTPESVVLVEDIVLRTKDSIKVKFVPREM
ncbi:cytochrome P450 4C1-like [Tribolium madens]|uniref:cytochrome P450 4C1-like n=1 Tax=Tribolium madens TaxID=41895 RepID=UPI001CF7451B|nr:cytochrome P450 4C1-like [Tribolium madens]